MFPGLRHRLAFAVAPADAEPALRVTVQAVSAERATVLLAARAAREQVDGPADVPAVAREIGAAEATGAVSPFAQAGGFWRGALAPGAVPANERRFAPVGRAKDAWWSRQAHPVDTPLGLAPKRRLARFAVSDALLADPASGELAGARDALAHDAHVERWGRVAGVAEPAGALANAALSVRRAAVRAIALHAREARLSGGEGALSRMVRIEKVRRVAGAPGEDAAAKAWGRVHLRRARVEIRRCQAHAGRRDDPRTGCDGGVVLSGSRARAPLAVRDTPRMEVLARSEEDVGRCRDGAAVDGAATCREERDAEQCGEQGHSAWHAELGKQRACPHIIPYNSKGSKGPVTTWRARVAVEANAAPSDESPSLSAGQVEEVEAIAARAPARVLAPASFRRRPRSAHAARGRSATARPRARGPSREPGADGSPDRGARG